jgi:hypothetical protein
MHVVYTDRQEIVRTSNVGAARLQYSAGGATYIMGSMSNSGMIKNRHW